MSDRLVLALDGSTRSSAAALLRIRQTAVGFDDDWEVVSRRSESDEQGHARALLRAIDDMVEEVGATPGDLRAVVVGTGPGTFTGVRIAVATARALGLSLDIPVLGVGTLSALAAGALVRATVDVLPEVVVPVVDARRSQLFYGVYRVCAASGVDADRPRSYRRASPLGVCDRQELPRTIGPDVGDVWVVGEAAPAVEVLPRGWSRFEAAVAPEQLIVGQAHLEEPAGVFGGRLVGPWIGTSLASGWDRAGLSMGSLGTPEAVKPVYVRTPDADIHIQKMRDPWGDQR